MNAKLKNFIFPFLIIFIFSCGTNKKHINQTEDIDYASYGKYIDETKKPQKFEPDLVPDEKTAIKLADVIWDARYGTPKGIRNMPYTVTLEENKVWYIKTNLEKGFFGQVLHIKINKYDGKIIYVWSEG